MEKKKGKRGERERQRSRGNADSVEHTPKHRRGSLPVEETGPNDTFKPNKFIRRKHPPAKVIGFEAMELYGDDAERFIEQG